MPMNYSTARELAVLLYDEPLAQVTELKRIRDDIYRIRFSDRHVSLLIPEQLVPEIQWFSVTMHPRQSECIGKCRKSVDLIPIQIPSLIETTAPVSHIGNWLSLTPTIARCSNHRSSLDSG
jgi:hypothetical protein